MSEKKKGKKGLVIALAVLLPLLIVGGVVGAAFAGLIKIPGITPKKAAMYGEANYLLDKDDAPKPTPAPEEEPKPETKEEKEPPKPKVQVTSEDPVMDEEQGAKKLAAIWNNMEAAQVLRLAAETNDNDLARIMAKMDAELVAEVLGTMPDARRAARLSLAIEKIHAIIPKPEDE